MYYYIIAVYFPLAGTFCGVFRRQALDRGAMALKVDKIVTGQLATLIHVWANKYLPAYLISLNIMSLHQWMLLWFHNTQKWSGCHSLSIMFLIITFKGHNADDIAETVIMNGEGYISY